VASDDAYVKLAGHPVLRPGGDGGAGGMMSLVGGAARGLGFSTDDSESFARDAAGRLASGPRNFVALPSERDLVSKSAFRFTLNAAEKAAGGSGGAWTVWGRGDAAGFDGRFDHDFSMDGDSVAAHLGIDYRSLSNVLMGMALSRRQGNVDYEFSGPESGDGDISMDLTSVHPYVHWSSRRGLSVWGALGAGRGGAELADDSGRADTDLKMFMVAAGTRGELFSRGALGLALKADAFSVRIDTDGREDLPEVNAESSRMRVALEGRAATQLEGGSRLTGRVEFGVRVDGGDAETGTGTELGATMGYDHPGGLRMQARGRFLLSNGKNDFDEWGASMEIALDPGVSGQGLQFSLTPAYGRASSGMDALWNRHAADALPGSDSGHRLGLAARVGYGWEMPGTRAVLTPFGEMKMLDGGSRRVRLGAEVARWNLGRSALALQLYGEQTKARRDTDRRVAMSVRWDF
jgi:hypothetical protein